VKAAAISNRKWRKAGIRRRSEASLYCGIEIRNESVKSEEISMAKAAFEEYQAKESEMAIMKICDESWRQ